MNKIKNNSEVLDKARKYENDFYNSISAEERPGFHLSAPIGWINDPNGFSRFNGEYHLFYQHHPYKTQWGPMHWGHSKSTDFIKWDQLPVALAPDEFYDKSGCFSGSAVEFDGKHVLMYTGVLENREEDGSNTVRQTQCIAIGDGINYEKLECNPVITSDLLPPGSSLEDFRDPKIWIEDGEFYVVVGSRHEDGSGQILLYSSKNLKEWELVTILDKSENKIGKMWECPDFFNIDGHDIIVISPQEMKAEKLDFHNGNNTVYIIGKYDKESKTFNRQDYRAIDYGIDFYAPQTFKNEDGRRIMIAWMQNWENRIAPQDFKWYGMMTMPREITVKDGTLIQSPVREIENYYKNTVEYKNTSIKEEVNLDGIYGRELDMTIEINDGDYSEFEIKIAKNEQYETIINYNKKKNILSFDRSYSGNYGDILHKREMNVKNQGGKIKLRLILDKYSAEIFVNDGEQVMTNTFYTPLDAKDISFSADGESIIDIVKHDIIV